MHLCRYLFSTYENDALLFHLDTSDNEESDEDDVLKVGTASAEQPGSVSDDEQARALLGHLMEDIEQDDAGNTGAVAGEDDGLSSEGNMYVCSDREQLQS